MEQAENFLAMEEQRAKEKRMKEGLDHGKDVKFGNTTVGGVNVTRKLEGVENVGMKDMPEENEGVKKTLEELERMESAEKDLVDKGSRAGGRRWTTFIPRSK